MPTIININVALYEADKLLSNRYCGAHEVNRYPTSTNCKDILDFICKIVIGRFPDLDGHHQRTAETAGLFTKSLGYSPEDCEIVSFGAQIHDIGKLILSDHILNKPARLTSAEFSLVKQHTTFGHELLSPLKLDVRIEEVVLFHHENFDGSGYPQGISGDSIPHFARILRILDTFDALTEDRPYHKGVDALTALEALQRDSHFYDPVFLQRFCEFVRDQQLVSV